MHNKKKAINTARSFFFFSHLCIKQKSKAFQRCHCLYLRLLLQVFASQLRFPILYFRNNKLWMPVLIRAPVLVCRCAFASNLEVQTCISGGWEFIKQSVGVQQSHLWIEVKRGRREKIAPKLRSVVSEVRKKILLV